MHLMIATASNNGKQRVCAISKAAMRRHHEESHTFGLQLARDGMHASIISTLHCKDVIKQAPLQSL